MNTRTPLILGVLCIAVLAFILLYEKNMKPSDRMRAEAKRIFSQMDTGAMDRITLDGGDVDVVLQKTKDQWELAKPIKGPADQQEIEMLLSDLQFTEHVQRFEIDGGEDQLKEFGLFKPRMTLRVKGAKDQYELRLGRETPVGGMVYVQIRKGSKEVLVVNKGMADKLLRSSDAWRDKQVQPIDQPSVRELALQGRGMDLAIARTDAGWQLSRPINARASGEAVNQLFSAIAGAAVSKFVAVDSSDQAGFGLNEPLKIILSRSAGDPLLLEIGSPLKNDPDQSYARSSHLGKSVFTIPTATVAALTPRVDALRDRRVARWNQGEVTRVRVQGANQAVEAACVKGAWKLGAEQRPANRVAVDQFLSKLAALDASRFVADVATTSKDYGLDQPVWRVELFRQKPAKVEGLPKDKLKDKDKPRDPEPMRPEAEEVSWFVLEFGRSEKDEIFVRSSLEPFVVAVPQQQVGFLPVQPWDWKEKLVGKLEAKSLEKVRVNSGTSVWELVPKGKEWECAVGTMEAQAIPGLIGQLTELQATKWLGPKPPLPAAQPTMVFHLGGQPVRELRVWARKSGEDALCFFAGVSEDYFDISAADLGLMRAALQIKEPSVEATTPPLTASPKAPAPAAKKRR